MVHFAGSPSSLLLIPTPSSLLAQGGFELIIQSFFDGALIVFSFQHKTQQRNYRLTLRFVEDKAKAGVTIAVIELSQLRCIIT